MTKSPLEGYKVASISSTAPKDVEVNVQAAMTRLENQAYLSSLIHALNHALRNSNCRFEKGVFVHKVVVYLDCTDLLTNLSQHNRGARYYNRGARYDNETLVNEDEGTLWRELYGVAGLLDKAGIQLLIRWNPSPEQVYPSSLAMKAAKEHLERADVSLPNNFHG